MRRALVLSGGGAKGSWQVGACQHLIVERGLWFDVIAGVSAGAVNAATLAQARNQDELAAELEHLRAVWLGLRGSRDVYRRRWLGALGTVLARRASLYNAAPLRASCALPLIFPPVPLGDGNELAVDGGLRSATPLADALAALAERRAPGDEPDDVWVLAPHVAEPVPWRAHHHWLWVALRAISVLTSAPLSQG